MTTFKTTGTALAFAAVVCAAIVCITSFGHAAELQTPTTQVLYRTVKVDGLDIFYREAGPKDAPAVLLLHGSLLTLDATKWQYTHGVRNVETVSPDTWDHVQPLLDRPGNQEIQLARFHSYGSNPRRYPQWQEYLRKHQPPTLIVWGKNDAIFPAAGAHPYKRDLENLEFHLLDTGHFAREEDGATIAKLIREFLGKQLTK